jgi:hypothetical protein
MVAGIRIGGWISGGDDAEQEETSQKKCLEFVGDVPVNQLVF